MGPDYRRNFVIPSIATYAVLGIGQISFRLDLVLKCDFESGVLMAFDTTTAVVHLVCDKTGEPR